MDLTDNFIQCKNLRTIVGHLDSTAQAFAEENNLAFQIIGITPFDVNSNGKVSTADAVILLRYLAEMEELTENQKLAANSYGDEPGIADAVAILRSLVDKQTQA